MKRINVFVLPRKMQARAPPPPSSFLSPSLLAAFPVYRATLVLLTNQNQGANTRLQYLFVCGHGLGSSQLGSARLGSTRLGLALPPSCQHFCVLARFPIFSLSPSLHISGFPFLESNCSIIIRIIGVPTSLNRRRRAPYAVSRATCRQEAGWHQAEPRRPGSWPKSRCAAQCFLAVSRPRELVR